MSTQKHGYQETKTKICQICERLFSDFNNDFISVDDKTTNEVTELINQEMDKEGLSGVDFTKFIYVCASNGSTLIKK